MVKNVATLQLSMVKYVATLQLSMVKYVATLSQPLNPQFSK